MRYPLAPLAAKLHIELGENLHGGQQPDAPPAGLAALAEIMGINHRNTRRLQTLGLTERQADHYAVRAGFHPSDIWPSWFDDAPGEEDDFYFDDPDFADVLDKVAS
jgi:hypothetical protein